MLFKNNECTFWLSQGCEKGHTNMTDTKSNQTASKLMQSVQETNKAITDTAVATQEGNLAFAQSILENGIEVLKSHAESSRSLLQDLLKQARSQQIGPGTLQTLVDSALAAQERNTQLAQQILENGVELLKSQLSAAHKLRQELEQQYQTQQDAFQTLVQESLETYKDFLFAPLTYWQKALNASQATAVEELQHFEQATQQGLETMRKSAHQTAAMTEKALRHSQAAAKKATE
jgi:hypothetical protein